MVKNNKRKFDELTENDIGTTLDNSTLREKYLYCEKMYFTM